MLVQELTPHPRWIAVDIRIVDHFSRCEACRDGDGNDPANPSKCIGYENGGAL